MKLPAAEWHQRASLKALISVLDGPARYVGGAVRDTLLGLPVSDVDLATPLLPEIVMERLKAAGIKVIPTGIDHGTVTAVTEDGPVEITTLRRDVSTDGRRATVAFSDDWREDAARRDFTINALSADPETLEVFDYFGGTETLETQTVRFIGSAKDRISEDYLRILRYFRFLSRFGKDRIDGESYAACKAAAAQLSTLSRERIADELMKLLAVDDPRFAVQKMLEADIFTHIIAGTDPEAAAVLDRLIPREKSNSCAPSSVRRLVALLPKDIDKADAITKSLRLSKKLQKAIAHRIPVKAGIHHGLVRLHDTGGDGPLPSQGYNDAFPNSDNIRALAYRTSTEAARDMALLFADDTDLSAILEQLKDWQPPIFPLTGGDLIILGLKPGPSVARTLTAIEQTWIDEGFPAKARIDELAASAVTAIINKQEIQ